MQSHPLDLGQTCLPNRRRQRPGLGMMSACDSPHQPRFDAFHAGGTDAQFRQFVAAMRQGRAVYDLGYYSRAHKQVKPFTCGMI